MSLPEVVSRQEWVAARKELLAKEKELTRARDAVSAERRRLPMVRIDEDYVFAGPGGEVRLVDLFEQRRQLIVYHAMWVPEHDQGCPSCSAFLDQIGHLSHLHAYSVTFAAVSKAPLPSIEAFKARMGWTFPWYSSEGSRFNHDFHVTLDESVAPFEYNFRTKEEIARTGVPVDEWEQPFDLHGLSVFLRQGDEVFHTYSAYARGTDNLGFISDFLDLTPLGRQEEREEPQGRAAAAGLPPGSAPFHYHDEYDPDVGRLPD